MKRKTALLCLTALLAALVSCGGETASKPAETQSAQDSAATETEAVTEERLYPAYELDLGGADFHMYYFDEVYVCGWSSDIPNDIMQTEETGDILADAVYRRNRAVEERYNVKLTADACLDWNFTQTLGKSVSAGDSVYDAVFPNWQSMGALVSNRYLLPLDGLLDTSLPWWDEKSLSGFSFAGKTLALSGDLTFMDKLTDIVLFFNKQMAKDYDLGDVYQTVIDRKWTFDYMMEICRMLSADLDSNGKYDRNDRFGFSAQNDASYELFNAAGETFCAFDKDGIPYQSNTGERAISVLMRVYDFMDDTQNYFNRQTSGLSVAETITMFKSNQVFVLMRPLQTIMELRSMDADFGIIPTPLMDDTQTEYATSIGYTVAIATALPADCKSPETSAAILDTMAAESYYSMNDVFYDMVLGSKVTRDDTSRQNLDIIFANHVYDPGCIYDFGGMVSNFLSYKKGMSGKITSTIEKYKPKVDADIVKYLSVLEEME